MHTIKRRLQVKDIIGYLDMGDHVTIEQLDVFLKGTPREDDSEEIYDGSVMDIPWYMMDYYLANTADCGALTSYTKPVEKKLNGTPALYIMVVEDEDRLDERYN